MAIKIYRTDERKKGNRLSLIFIRKISQCLVFGVFGAAQRNTSFHLGKGCLVQLLFLMRPVKPSWQRFQNGFKLR